jgi:hypothetical protein
MIQLLVFVLFYRYIMTTTANIVSISNVIDNIIVLTSTIII